MTIHEAFADALKACGVDVVTVMPYSGKQHSPNPTTIVVRASPRRVVQYHVFAWRVTGEGKGRSGDNFRIQGTSFGQGNSPIAVDEWVIGLGWSSEYGVFVGFDPWVKRNPGTSSSVHIKRHLLELGAADAWAEGDEDWDPRVVLHPSRAGQFLDWFGRLWTRKLVSLKATAVDRIDPDHIRARVNPWSSRQSYRVRLTDRVALFDSVGENPDPYLWRVQQIDVVERPGRNRFDFLFTCEKSARVQGALPDP